jgi:hypothetical protein
MPSDSDAYGGANVQPADHRIFYQISGAFTGRRTESYAELVPGFEALPGACHLTGTALRRRALRPSAR